MGLQRVQPDRIDTAGKTWDFSAGHLKAASPTDDNDVATKAYADTVAPQAVWGSITGTLSAQSDLSSALGYKYDKSNPDGFISDLTGFDTSDLLEGSNLYFTDDRAKTAVTGMGLNSFTNNVGFITDLSSFDTTDLNEGDNLYFTNDRATSAVAGLNLSYFTNDLGFITDLSSFTTSDLVEGTNLYYTQDRFDNAFGIAFGGMTTDDLTEGISNLYDKVVSLTEGTGIEITGTYPSFTIAATGVPGGSNTQVQFNDEGVFGGDIGFTYENNFGSRILTLGCVDGETTYQGTLYGPILQVGSNLGQQPYFTFAGNQIIAGWAGSPEETEDGGDLVFLANLGGETSGDGGSVYFRAGGAMGGDSNGGNVIFSAGVGHGMGDEGHIWFQNSLTEMSAIFDLSSLTQDRFFTFPDAEGIIALTSDLTSYVPYTGATGDVDLGAYSLSANQGIFQYDIGTPAYGGYFPALSGEATYNGARTDVVAVGMDFISQSFHNGTNQGARFFAANAAKNIGGEFFALLGGDEESMGVLGDVSIGETDMAGKAIGGKFISDNAHGGGSNYGVYSKASGAYGAGNQNYSFYGEEGDLYNNGSIQGTSYKSADGSTGATGSFTTADSKTVSVKNGIIVSIT